MEALHANPARIAALHAIRDAHRGEATATQRQRLLVALQTLGHVTTFEAMRHLDIFDPRPRKLELVREGHEILTLRRNERTESGERHCIGLYTLKKGASHAA
ncbi:helix-turn-helix domain-containing protein [Inhella proteolytica]|uniref:Helix-turn-helix domain-containing protein n=1 Tax=Inhella proteolytica TaxID=2795029 RepID=A0A931NH52_9BURK|nr:helix-turn-helix domain-containing protein [Inhella proteolytica]MBH9577861.1 helix-turn-helix domain-containing protein [Inhella proteolytica]